MNTNKKWVVRTAEPVLQHIFTNKLGVSPLLAQLLINRGIYTVRDARNFLLTSMQDLHAPVLMRDLPKAVEALANALDGRQRLLVYGDYDVDGITGTTLLVDLLRRLGGLVEYYIPNRITEGYGLNLSALAKARESGVNLIITVDCGISSAAEVEINNNLGGPQIIITDHHEPPAALPDALAVINPKQQDCGYPFKELAGVGVAYKLGCALLEKLGNPFHGDDYLDLVCLGTVADIVVLQDENRVLVKHGLTRLNQTERPGLQALYQVGGIKAGGLSTRDLSFVLAPRLNAAGRLGDAATAVELLLAENDAKAAHLAQEINKKNSERQKIESAVMQEALALLASDPELVAGEVLVLSSPKWHPGVIGIVASRLVDRLHKPVLMVSLAGEQGKGSARSVSGFDLYRSLEYCADCLEGYGGHEMAAGFTVAMEKIEQLRLKINEYAGRYFAADEKIPALELDALISLADITSVSVSEIEQLAPFGQGNPDPLFGVLGANLISFREVGNQKAHLKMLLGEQRVNIDGIGFNFGLYAAKLKMGQMIDVAFKPSINTWQGKSVPQLNVKDIQINACVGDDAANIPAPAMEELSAAGDLILIPESIIGLLRDLLQDKGHDLVPEMHALTALMADPTDSKPSWAPRTSGQLPATISRLKTINPGKEKVILLVNSAGHIVQYNKYIHEYSSHQQNTPICLHGFMRPQLIKESMDRYIETPAGLLITTFSSLILWKDTDFFFDRVILINPPVLKHDYALLQKYTSTCAEDKLEILYAPAAWEENRRLLEELAPDRKLLASYFSLLRSQAGHGQTKCKRTAIIKQMRQCGHNLISWLSLVTAVAVFEELGLMQYHWQQDVLVYTLLSVGGPKKDLHSSLIYNKLHQYKNESLDWINKNNAGSEM